MSQRGLEALVIGRLCWKLAHECPMLAVLLAEPAAEQARSRLTRITDSSILLWANLCSSGHGGDGGESSDDGGDNGEPDTLDAGAAKRGSAHAAKSVLMRALQWEARLPGLRSQRLHRRCLQLASSPSGASSLAATSHNGASEGKGGGDDGSDGAGAAQPHGSTLRAEDLPLQPSAAVAQALFHLTGELRRACWYCEHGWSCGWTDEQQEGGRTHRRMDKQTHRPTHLNVKPRLTRPRARHSLAEFRIHMRR